MGGLRRCAVSLVRPRPAATAACGGRCGCGCGQEAGGGQRHPLHRRRPPPPPMRSGGMPHLGWPGSVWADAVAGCGWLQLGLCGTRHVAQVRWGVRFPAPSGLARSRAWRGLVAQSLRTGRTKGLEPRRLNRKTRRWAHEDTDACRSLRHHAPFPFPVLALIRVGRTTSRRCSCQHPRLLLYLPHPLAPLIPWRRRSWCPRRRLLRMRRRAAPSSRCRR